MRLRRWNCDGNDCSSNVVAAFETVVINSINATIEDFGVSGATLRGGANSGQASIKCRDLASAIGSTAVRKLWMS